MTLSERGVEFIIKEEGCVLKVYKDQVGKETIGIGHLIKEGESFTKITRDEAIALFRKDIKGFETAIETLVRFPLEQHEWDALVSLVFNIGTGNFTESSVLRYLNDGKKEAAAESFLKWDKGRINGKLVVLPVLQRRRERERQLFLNAKY